jgi:hypothetical protein
VNPQYHANFTDTAQVEEANGAKPGELRTMHDQKLPRFLSDYMKQWGGKLEKEWLPDSDSDKGNLIIRITPEMKADLSEGGKGQAYNITPERRDDIDRNWADKATMK